ncbi:MAG: 4Fe-4S cluster-binding domain-containing protein [Gracilibacteraceae bacterium]|jgi:anaerobic ribonucleoside-triphosphate reductase activating protein|nr:4Fe-4S cluster-binding domain-containing protein [Gracilibacteraceae bacterium]
MLLRIADLVNDSIVDGPGLRLAVFCQGCRRRCPGCHNPATWAEDGGRLTETGEILAAAARNPLLDGLTITGGEPLLQAAAAAELAAGARERGLHVTLYTGYTWEEITAGPPDWQALLRSVNLLVDGPFAARERDIDLLFRGSANQRLLDVPASLVAGTPVWADLS